MDLVMSLAGVSQEVAERALAEHGSVEAALDALIQKPTVAGDTYLPPKPIVNTGLDPEQEARCRKGRWLQDQVNVVVSVAQTQVRSPPEQEEAPGTEEVQTQQTTVPTTTLPESTPG